MQLKEIEFNIEDIEKALDGMVIDVARVAAESCENQVIPLETIKRWSGSPKKTFRFAAMKACANSEINTDDILRIIEGGLRDTEWTVYMTAMDACVGRTIPSDIKERWMASSDWRFRQAAGRTSHGDEISLEKIRWYLANGDLDVRVAAMNACKEREIPAATIKEWLADGDFNVREAARKIAEERGIEVYSRTFKPPTKVYKKCVGGVIVEAHIPDDAHVRGSVGHKCRASKAIITKIYGTTIGRQCGISLYDHTIVYHKGDVVTIPDFDFSNDSCAQGFHFFCTREEAGRY